jgi:hypothetical protein
MSSTVGDEEHGMTRGCNWVAGGETHPRPTSAPGDESTGRLASGRGHQDSAAPRFSRARSLPRHCTTVGLVQLSSLVQLRLAPK